MSLLNQIRVARDRAAAATRSSERARRVKAANFTNSEHVDRRLEVAEEREAAADREVYELEALLTAYHCRAGRFTCAGFVDPERVLESSGYCDYHLRIALGDYETAEILGDPNRDALPRASIGPIFGY